jgi:hypothetical protein
MHTRITVTVATATASARAPTADKRAIALTLLLGFMAFEVVVGVLTWDFETEAVSEKLNELGGPDDHHRRALCAGRLGGGARAGHHAATASRLAVGGAPSVGSCRVRSGMPCAVEGGDGDER